MPSFPVTRTQLLSLSGNSHSLHVTLTPPPGNLSGKGTAEQVLSTFSLSQGRKLALTVLFVPSSAPHPLEDANALHSAARRRPCALCPRTTAGYLLGSRRSSEGVSGVLSARPGRPWRWAHRPSYRQVAPPASGTASLREGLHSILPLPRCRLPLADVSKSKDQLLCACHLLRERSFVI